MTQQDEGEGVRMTLEDRVEAMVAEMVRRPEVGDDIGKTLWRGAQSVARQYLAAAFPELFASPPEAWLAPLELTDEDIRSVHTANLVPLHGLERESAARDLWRHMVRPHLKELP